MNILKYTYGSEHWEEEGVELTGFSSFPSLFLSITGNTSHPLFNLFYILRFEEDLL